MPRVGFARSVPILLALLLLFGPSPPMLSTQESGELSPSVIFPLGLEVEGRAIADVEDVEFYPEGVPRVHRHGLARVSEREFFEIAGDTESATQARKHRSINVGLTVLSMLGLFSGLVLFGAADQVDLPVNGRRFSMGLVASSVAPAAAVLIRGQNWAPLTFSYDTMREHNDR